MTFADQKAITQLCLKAKHGYLWLLKMRDPPRSPQHTHSKGQQGPQGKQNMKGCWNMKGHPVGGGLRFSASSCAAPFTHTAASWHSAGSLSHLLTAPLPPTLLHSESSWCLLQKSVHPSIHPLAGCSHQQHLPAPPGEPRGVSRPGGICNPSSDSWSYPGASKGGVPDAS